MDLKHEFQNIMDGTSGTPPGVALGDLARHLARSGQHISITALLGDGAPREWRAVASSVVHLAMGRVDDTPAPVATVPTGTTNGTITGGTIVKLWEQNGRNFGR